MNIDSYTKFVIIGNERTGSTFLQTLLDAHPQIISYGEIFHLLSIEKEKLSEVVHDPIKYVDQTINRQYPDHINAVGYKMVYSEIGADNIFLRTMETVDVAVSTKLKREQFSHYMRSNYNLAELRKNFDDFLNHLKDDLSVKIIHIKRRNLLDTFLSKRLASRSGAWSSRNGSYLPGSTHVDFDECLAYFEQVDALEKRYDVLFKGHGVIDVIYEELIANLDEILKRVQTFLDVQFSSLSSQLTKQNVRRNQEVISNYSQLKESFQGSRWIKYFNA